MTATFSISFFLFCGYLNLTYLHLYNKTAPCNADSSTIQDVASKPPPPPSPPSPADGMEPGPGKLPSRKGETVPLPSAGLHPVALSNDASQRRMNSRSRAKTIDKALRGAHGKAKPPAHRDTIVKMRGRKIVETTTIDATTEVEGLLGQSQLTVHPRYLPPEVCESLVSSVLDSGFLRQYQRYGGTYDEPRLHVLCSQNASPIDSETGPGYCYKDVHMKAIQLDKIPGLETVATELAAFLGVSRWGIGVDVVVYASGADGMGYHADNSQGETIIACITLQNTEKPRPVLIKPNDDGCKYKLLLGAGSLYVMNADMQQHYVHKVPKLSKKEINPHDMRIVLVFRDGKSVQTSDSGAGALLESRMNRPDSVQFGPIPGIEEGVSYSRTDLISTFAHRAGIRAVNGSVHRGCDSIVLSRNSRMDGEADGMYSIVIFM